MPRPLAALTAIIVLTTARSLTGQNQQLPPHPVTPPQPSWVTHTMPGDLILSARDLPYQLISGQPPTSRSGHTAIWTGTEMIIWGGYNGSGSLNSGGRYDPTTNEWTTTTTNGAPTGRSFHTAVWTGSEMIIWGGLSGNRNISDEEGWRYSPVTDRWTPITTNGAPSPRTFHTVVWTGKEMIVWGGYGDPMARGRYLNSGDRYNPSTDSWTPITTIGAPVARSRHTAVWTGSEMLVWGGIGHRMIPPSGSYRGFDLSWLNSGGRYDPTTDSWKPITDKDAPAEREVHTAIWTGKEMIIWGGYNRSFPRDGGRYDPLHDSWVPMATSGAPDERRDHTAVWTGKEMIIWGGHAAAISFFNSGGRYNPATDTWTSTTFRDAPPKREMHTAVWSGLEMIVWGGSVVPVLNDGGRYNPARDTWIPIPPSENEVWVPHHESPKK